MVTEIPHEAGFGFPLSAIRSPTYFFSSGAISLSVPNTTDPSCPEDVAAGESTIVYLVALPLGRLETQIPPTNCGLAQAKVILYLSRTSFCSGGFGVLFGEQQRLTYPELFTYKICSLPELKDPSLHHPRNPFHTPYPYTSQAD